MGSPFTLRISVSSDQGGRKYMEDVTQILVEPEPGEGELPWEEEEDEEADSPNRTAAQDRAFQCKAGVKSGQCVGFFAVFDGHGGREAAHFARDHLWSFIRKQKGFMSRDPQEVCAAISKGFIACHHAMWKKLREYTVMPAAPYRGPLETCARQEQCLYHGCMCYCLLNPSSSSAPSLYIIDGCGNQAGTYGSQAVPH